MGQEWDKVWPLCRVRRKNDLGRQAASKSKFACYHKDVASLLLLDGARPGSAKGRGFDSRRLHHHQGT